MIAPKALKEARHGDLRPHLNACPVADRKKSSFRYLASVKSVFL